MANVLSYINTGSLSGTSTSGPSKINGAWCRPQHKPTCCIYVSGGNTCCMCVPTTATCFVIEMWGQGGGGAGGCCCGVGAYGGQGGSYGWVTCTTSGTNHILCACACQCCCVNGDTICTGHCGQFSKVTQCNSPSNIWCVSGGSMGMWCCSPSSPQPWCYRGSTAGTGTQGKYNTYLYLKNNSASLASGGTTTSSGALALSACASQSITPTAISYTGCCAAAPGGAGAGWDTAELWGALNSCACFSSPYVWSGACGWSDVSSTNNPFACLNGSPAQSGIPNSTCGFGVGVGGAAYAGGDQAYQGEEIGNCYTGGGCYSQHGNFPGGGGMSAWTQTAQGRGSFGGPGLILMSWC